ncbi:CBS domain-containing protein [Mesorhizobium sp. 1B3]|uniref:CBS domain-containing protein n=1 Tax=Mesorhizobium sp. 1B3 TaxID=3243599 RepID=UPI003D98132B
MKASDVMTTKVVTVTPDHSVRHAAEIMLDNHVSGLPVIDDSGELVGIISEGDLLRRSELGLDALAGHRRSPEEQARAYVKAHAWKVGDVMSDRLVVVDEDTDLARVATLMEENDIKRVPVARDGRLVGIVSRADLLRAVASARLDATAPGDEAIRRSILARLDESTGLARMNISVTVADGLVHLWGNVEGEDCRKAARVVADGVRGVKGVIEHFADAE